MIENILFRLRTKSSALLVMPVPKLNNEKKTADCTFVCPAFANTFVTGCLVVKAR
jgi:hypothetical protein